MKINGEEQLDIFGEYDEKENSVSMAIDVPNQIKVVDATFGKERVTNWADLFEGFDHLFAITFSSGIDFVNKVVGKFRHAEIIFGCEGVLSSETEAVIAMQAEVVRHYAKRKSAREMAARIDDGTLKLFVSRDTRSHEKIFVMSSVDGRTRVVTGSANMSGSAFLGIQRENIICFDDADAFNYYKELFDDFKENCSDSISREAIVCAIADNDYLEDNIQEIPILKTVTDKKIVILDGAGGDQADVEIVASVKGFESELKPMIPKQKKKDGKILLTGETVKEISRKHKENRDIKKFTEKKLPKLHLDFESRLLDFNGKQITLNPRKEIIRSDINCLVSYFNGFNNFNGKIIQNQKSYFTFMNWFFASIFLPYLRLIAHNNNYDMIPFPVFGIIYGDSNGGKSTFTRLLSKMMCGHRVPLNSTNDFTSTEIENLKRGREGLPIVIDDLAKMQFQNNNEKIIKDDEWGIPEKFVNYPAVVITTNKLPSITPDISKRAVTCHIDAKINKEAGAKNSKRVNDSMKTASTAFFGEYVRIMLDKIDSLENAMKTEDDYFPDIFKLSSETICEIFNECEESIPDYVSVLSFSDYFGDRAVSRNAIEKIKNAWKNEPKQFKIDKKANKLIYSCGENGNVYALKYIYDELPPSLNAQLNATSLAMDLDEAVELFGETFRKRLFDL